MSASIGDNLFNQRRDQVSAESAQAAELAQEIFNSALTSDDSSQVDLESLSTDAQGRILSSTTSPGSTGIAILREPGQTTPVNMTPALSRGFPSDVLSDALRTAVQKDTGRRGRRSAAVAPMAPQRRRTPAASICNRCGCRADPPESPPVRCWTCRAPATTSCIWFTTSVTHRKLSASSSGPSSSAGSPWSCSFRRVTYLVVRLVVGPIRVAAETSEKLAAGQLEQRIPVRGEDVIATLGRSFNRMADSLQKQITKLAELSRVQQRFVADVSHELRTPLTTIRLAGDVLYDQRDDFARPPGARQNFCTRRSSGLRRCWPTCWKSADTTRARSSWSSSRPTSFGWSRRAVEAVRPLADERGSDIRVVAPGGYFEADVDARRIRRILRNLLGNAIEHGDAKPIVVTVDSNASAVAIAVRDHGTGMKQTDASQVFERFWRADPSRQRTIGGTGLGLSIALEDAALHDGVLEVWSEEGSGTCFRLTLPRELGGVVDEYPVSLPPDDPATRTGGEQCVSGR